MIDPLGLVFESFDPVGKWREKDQDQPVDARGTLIDGTQVNGIVELKALLLSRKDEFARCFTEKLLTYALGRGLEYYDRPTVERILAALAAENYRFSALVTQMARSDPFRQRRGL